MKTIIGYIKGYFYETDKRVLATVTMFTALLIFLNYHFGIDDRIDDQQSFRASFFGRAAIFFIAFGFSYLAYLLLTGRNYFHNRLFVILFMAAPFIFALKGALTPALHFSNDGSVIISGTMFFTGRCCLSSLLLYYLLPGNYPVPISRSMASAQRVMNWQPYIIMLLIMIPLIAAASTQPDFLRVYPKLKLITDVGNINDLPWWKKLLFELSYGSDFITIELFFRGFLVLAFVKWAGKDAILPMACFYCTIHFGKPLGECISSYFGGMILGIVVYHTRSILGGLMVHLGIAWLMEIGGYIGN
ncbi:MAG: CPBP family intramembrane glutamic endopeptidase [Bacteroidota bacterium]